MNIQSRVRVNGTLSDTFLMKTGLHVGIVLSLLSMTTVPESLSGEIRSGIKIKLKEDVKFK